MLNRRLALGLAGGLLAAPLSSALAQTAPRELVFAIIPAENAGGVTERYGPFIEYLTRETGIKTTLRIATDYAAIIEGQRAGQIHVAYYGPSSFARALTTGAKIEAFAQEVNLDGSRGYHSVFYVKADSPFAKIDDLKGKNLGLVDPNSTSGNNVPRFAMHKMGITPEQFFGRVVYTGSHENAIIALQQGTVDVAANWWNDEQESNLLRMARKTMAKAEDFRIIFKSDQIVNSPIAYLTDLPEDLKRKIREAVLTIEKRAPDVWQRISDGKSRPWAAVDNKAYDPIIELNGFIDGLRRRS